MPKQVTDCKHCEQIRPSRMIRFPVISPAKKRHWAENHMGKDYTSCAGSLITEKWTRLT